MFKRIHILTLTVLALTGIAVIGVHLTPQQAAAAECWVQITVMWGEWIEPYDIDGTAEFLDAQGQLIGEPVELIPDGSLTYFYGFSEFPLEPPITVRFDWDGGGLQWGREGEDQPDPEMPPEVVPFQGGVTGIKVWCSANWR